jgi:hypothetical protein
VLISVDYSLRVLAGPASEEEQAGDGSQHRQPRNQQDS